MAAMMTTTTKPMMTTMQTSRQEDHESHSPASAAAAAGAAAAGGGGLGGFAGATAMGGDMKVSQNSSSSNQIPIQTQRQRQQQQINPAMSIISGMSELGGGDIKIRRKRLSMMGLEDASLVDGGGGELVSLEEELNEMIDKDMVIRLGLIGDFLKMNHQMDYLDKLVFLHSFAVICSPPISPLSSALSCLFYVWVM